MDRPRHPKPELEKILKQMEALECRVDKPGTYFRCRCPCGKHTTRVHLSPSNPHHGKQRLQHVRSWNCFQKKEGS